MTSLIFLATVLTLLILLISFLIGMVRRKPVAVILKRIGLIILGYGLVWTVFKLNKNFVQVPPGTQICFDDWCATIIKTDRLPATDSTLIILHIEMFNKARGIAQTPSEPRLNIIDADGRIWAYSMKGQMEYEKNNGVQPGMAHRLELHESMQTALVFKLPKNARSLAALIEEGPWITQLMFPMDEQVFLIRSVENDFKSAE